MPCSNPCLQPFSTEATRRKFNKWYTDCNESRTNYIPTLNAKDNLLMSNLLSGCGKLQHGFLKLEPLPRIWGVGARKITTSPFLYSLFEWDASALHFYHSAHRLLLIYLNKILSARVSETLRRSAPPHLQSCGVLRFFCLLILPGIIATPAPAFTTGSPSIQQSANRAFVEDSRPSSSATEYSFAAAAQTFLSGKGFHRNLTTTICIKSNFTSALHNAGCGRDDNHMRSISCSIECEYSLGKILYVDPDQTWELNLKSSAEGKTSDLKVLTELRSSLVDIEAPAFSLPTPTLRVWQKIDGLELKQQSQSKRYNNAVSCKSEARQDRRFPSQEGVLKSRSEDAEEWRSSIVVKLDLPVHHRYDAACKQCNGYSFHRVETPKVRVVCCSKTISKIVSAQQEKDAAEMHSRQASKTDISHAEIDNACRDASFNSNASRTCVCKEISLQSAAAAPDLASSGSICNGILRKDDSPVNDQLTETLGDQRMPPVRRCGVSKALKKKAESGCKPGSESSVLLSVPVGSVNDLPWVTVLTLTAVALCVVITASILSFADSHTGKNYMFSDMAGIYP